MANEVVRRLTISATSTGIDEQTGKLNKLAAANTNVAEVIDTNAKRALSAEAAFSKLTNQIDETARAQQAIEKGTKTLNAALAQGVITQDQYNQSLGLLNAKYSDVEESSGKAADGLKLSGVEAASVANHIAKAAVALYAFSPAFRAIADPAISAGLRASGGALAAMSPVLVGVISHLVSGILPLLSRVAAIALPLALLRAEIDLIAYAWQSAGRRIEDYNKLNTEAANTGMSAEFLQRQAKGFEAVGAKIDDATASLKKFAEISQSKLGGSELDKKLNAHLEVGNVSKGGVLSVQNAEGLEGKYRALTALLTKMADEGKKLAALDIGATFLSPSTLEGFRKSNDYLTNIQQNADKIAATKLISQEDINDAVQLQNRYDAAVKILGERWIPFQETITQGGMVLQRVWVNILETLASALTSITNFAAKIGEIIQNIPGLVTGLKSVGSAAANMIPGVAVGRAVYGAITGGGDTFNDRYGAVSNPYDTARSKLAPGLSNKSQREAWATQGTGISDRFRPDTSKVLEETEEYADAIDRVINSITKHIEVQKADAKSIGKGVEEQARLRVEAQQTAAVQANGGKITADQAKKFEKLKEEAGQTALALEKVKVASDIKFDKDTLFLSPENVRIAQQLRGLYGNDIPRALASPEAAAMRLNNTLRDVKGTAQEFTTDLVKGLMAGKTGMEALASAAQNLSAKLADKAIQSLFSLDFTSAAIQGIGAIISGIVGKSAQQSADLDKAKKAWEGMADQVKAFNAAAAGFDLGPLTSQVRTLFATVKELQKAAADAKDLAAVNSLGNTFNRGLERLTQEFIYGAAVLTPLQKAMKDVTDEATGLKDVFGEKYAGLGDLIDAALPGRLAAVAASFKALNEATLIADINTANGVGYINDVSEAFKKVADLSTQGVDAGLLDTWFKTTVQGIVNGAKLTGAAFEDLIQKFPTLAGAVTDFSQSLEGIAAAQAVAQAAAEAAAEAAKARIAEAESKVASAESALRAAYQAEASALQTTIDKMKQFVSQLRAFREGLLLNKTYSTLSPFEQYQEAQRQFRATAGKAAAGDEDALSRLQDVSIAYLDASKSYYASSEQYFRDFTEVQRILEQSQDAATRQVDVAEEQLAALKTQVEALITINESVLSVKDAISALADARAAATSAGSTKYSTSGTSSSSDWDFEASLRAAVERMSGPVFYKNGGVVGMAGGGVVGNGIWNEDSVLARYAGGGSIALAGGEFVMPATKVNQNLPMLEAMRSGASSGGDSKAAMVELGRIIAVGNSALVERIQALEVAYREGSREIATETRRASDKKQIAK